MSENKKDMLKDEEIAGVSGGNYNRYHVGDEYMILCPYCCSFHWSPCISSTVSYENYTFKCPVIGKRIDKKYTPDDEDEYVYGTVNMNYADFYYVLKVKVVDDHYSYDELKLSDINSQNSNDTFSPYSPKVLIYSRENRYS